MAIIFSNGYETAAWIDKDDIDMAGLTVQSTRSTLENAVGVVFMDV